ncbi:hypothetical protein C5C18_03135 [Rathayibacter tritici]|uniref:Uncharacterized protein n=1 Tax=Rathayibacter tritici TaxID=33888 RepID=A0A160KTL2_9MICO|nr:hypothetical protein [Rathayibacter tritici]AND17146.1 hypothetical protein A6122_2021 [Rathayibacter tritici]PPF30651.1 hypothetical protein C5C06_04515 [Rathayibacter tritici]PPF70808.1 hypothetical protein C5C21_00685 [Rathayibacter tritici]PPG08816.1 hypothetical protein C5C18_03135 [Rathayibacter tritici]PPI14880.1 hypothetical protein C5D07_07440 [Rathayibacter tritici]
MNPVLAGPGLRAAEQLLVRAGCLRPEHPWTSGPATAAAPRIDFAVLAEQACLLDLSEEAVARIAVSLATGRAVDLRSAFGHLTRDHAALVMTAVAVACGHDQVSSRIRVVGEERRVETVLPLADWPS